MPEATTPSVSAGGTSAQVASRPDAGPRAGRLLFDISGTDLAGRVCSKSQIEEYIPHRGVMSLLDWIVWKNDANTRGIGLKRVRNDEFWVKGHFPARAMLPGVLMVEAGAQLACFLYNIRAGAQQVLAFTRIEECAFRSSVQPGDDLYLLCDEVKFGRRNFVSRVQGIVSGKVAFDALISGMRLE